MKKIIFLVATLFVADNIFAQNGLGLDAPEKETVSQFVINPLVKHQTMSNFSASDGWSMQFVGLWPQQKVSEISDLLFSTENDKDGKPKGIGLSLWRFNIGAGSAEQGDSSQIGSPWTRSECFLLPDGTYDWSKQQGQRNFLQEAKKRGVDQFLGFILSAPVYWTQNGLATNTGRGATFNIQPDRYDDFARFMADVTVGLEKYEGIKLNYICPFNEPDGHWNWVGPKQEGTAATNKEIAQTVRELSKEYVRRNINTQILVSESFDYNCLYRVHPQTGADRGYQIQSFFTPDSVATYLGDVPNVPRLMAAHSYWTNTPLNDLRSIRRELGETLKKHDVGFWQTEYCIMSNDKEIGYGGGFDRTMKTALYVARIIHHDIVYAGAASWQWWRSIATGDYKDGLIIAHPDSTLKDGTYQDSKLLWALGNYSRFIRPGAVRLDVEALNQSNTPITDGDTDQFALMTSAYQNIDGSPVVVVVNYSKDDKEFNLTLKGGSVASWKPYVTSDKEGYNLHPEKAVESGKKITIPARSIVTFVEE